VGRPVVAANVGDRVHEREHFFGRRRGPCKTRDEALQGLVGPVHHVPVELKSDELADGERVTAARRVAVQDQFAAVPWVFTVIWVSRVKGLRLVCFL
jgi:hypothetical protein